MKHLVTLALVLALASFASADVLKMKSGTTLTGEIVKETDTSVTIRIEGGKITLDRSEIAEIVREGGPAPAPEKKGAESGPRPEPAPRPERLLGGVDVLRAMENGSVRVEARGHDLRTLKLYVEPKGGAPIRLKLPEGTFFYFQVHGEDRRPAQDLIATKTVRFTVEGDPIVVDVPVVGVDLGLRAPDGVDRYEPSRNTRPKDLGRLASVMPWAEPNAVQAAVWIVAGDATYEELVSPRRLASGPPITDADVMHGIRLVDVSGLDLGSRKIAADRFLLVGALAPPGGDSRLANWAGARLRVLGYGGSPSEIVIRVLDADPDERMLVQACRVAAELSLADAVPSIRRLVERKHSSLSVQAEASRALGVLTRPATGTDPGSARAADGPRKPPAATPEGLAGLLAALDRSDDREQRGALRALKLMEDRVESTIDRRRVASALVKYFLERDCAYRTEAREVIEEFRDAADVAWIIQGTQSTDTLLKRDSVRLLGAFPDALATRRLVQILNEPDGELCEDALRGLVERRDARALLIATARKPDVGLRRATFRYLREVEPGPDVELALIQGLADSDRQVRLDAIRGLSQREYTESDRAVPELKRLVSGDPEAGVRGRAADLLVEILGDGAVPILEAAVRQAKTDSERRALSSALRRARSR